MKISGNIVNSFSYDEMDCILQFGPINSGSSEKTLMCIGKLIAHTLFLNRAVIYRSKWYENGDFEFCNLEL